MKQCTKCKEWKSLSEFNKDNRAKDGLLSCCKECKKEWRQNNKNIIKSWQQKYYIQNKKHIKQSKQKWHIKNISKNNKRSNNYKKSNAKYETYKEKLTIDESPRLAEDDISLDVKCRYCGKYFIPSNRQVD